jgi:hypothetical protein
MPTAKQKKGEPPPSASKAAKPTTPSFANPDKRQLKRVDNHVARKAAKEVERARRRDEYLRMQAEAVKTSRSSIYDYVKDWPRKVLPGSDEPFTLKRWVASTTGAAPVVYTDALGVTLEDLITHGITLDCISTLQGLPGHSELVKWLTTAGHPFQLLFTRAKTSMVPFLEEQALMLAREPMPGEVRITRTGTGSKGETIDSEEVRIVDNVQRATLAFNAYQWTLAHLVPKKHGRQAVPDDGNAPLKDLLAEFRARNKQMEDGDGE